MLESLPIQTTTATTNKGPTVQGPDNKEYPISWGSIDDMPELGIMPHYTALPNSQTGDFEDSVRATFKQNSTTFNLGRSLLVRSTFDSDEEAAKYPDFNPFKNLDVKYLLHPDTIAQARTPFDLDKAKTWIDTMEQERQTMAKNPAGAFVGNVIAGVADPVNLAVPGTAARLIGKTTSFLGAVAKSAAIGAAVGVPFEANAMALNEQHTLKDALINVASYGLMGAAFGPFTYAGERVFGAAEGGLSSGTISEIGKPVATDALADSMKFAIDEVQRQNPENALRTNTIVSGASQIRPETATSLSDSIGGNDAALDQYLAENQNPVEIENPLSSQDNPALGSPKKWQQPPEDLSNLTDDEYKKQLESEGLAKSNGLFNWLTSSWFRDYQPSIAARMLTSDSAGSRQLLNKLADHEFILKKSEAGIALDPSLESEIHHGILENYTAITSSFDDHYTQYRQGGGTMTITQFEDSVAQAARRGGEWNDPHVAAVAKVYADTMKSYMQRYIDAGLLPKDYAEGTNTYNYFTRAYDYDKINSNITDFRQIIRDEVGKMFNGKDYAGLSALEKEKSISSNIEQIVGNILGRRYFDLDHLKVVDSNLKERTLHMSDLKLEPYLKNNVLDISKQYITKAERDLKTMDRFGTTDPQEIINQHITDDYNKNIFPKISDPKELAKARARMESDQKDAGVLLERIMGTRGRPQDPNSLGSNFVKGVSVYNYVRLLGSVLASKIPEFGRTAVVQMATAHLADHLQGVVDAVRNARLSPKELQMLGITLASDSRYQAMFQGEPILHDMSTRNGAFATTLNTASTLSSKLNGMIAMDNFTRRLIAQSHSERILNYAKAIDAGVGDQSMVNELAQSGIGVKDVRKLLDQYEKHHEVVDGNDFLNTHMWQGDQADAFRAAVTRHTNSNILMPGAADKFLFTDASPLARLMMQFRVYTQGAWARMILPGLQRGNGEFLGMQASMLSLGALAAGVHYLNNNREPESVGQVIEDSIYYSAVLGYLWDFSSTGMETFFGKGTGRQRMQGRLDTSLGPTAGLVSNNIPAFGRLVQGTANANDYRQVKSLVPYNNVLWWNGYLNRVVQNAAPPPKESHH